MADEAAIPFIRLTELNNRPELYADLYHMNFSGAETMTALLARKIDELGLEPGPGVCEER